MRKKSFGEGHEVELTGGCGLENDVNSLNSVTFSK